MSAGGGVIIEVRGLCLSYPGAGREVFPVLENVSFSARSGERIALIGANGAGKSSLLLSLAGVIDISAGSVTIDGIPLGPKTLPALRRRAGYVFQNPDDQLFMPTLWEDVLFGPRNYAKQDEEERLRHGGASPPPFSKTEEKAERLLASLGIAALKSRMSHKLSGGEKRLGALAGVLLMEPAVLLMDEPTAFLDPRGVRRLREVLKELPQTMLIATHDARFAAGFCERALILAERAIRADGPIADILADTALLERCGL